MKIYVSLSKKNRKLLKYAILFVLGCILIYYLNILSVSAATISSNSIYSCNASDIVVNSTYSYLLDGDFYNGYLGTTYQGVMQGFNINFNASIQQGNTYTLDLYANTGDWRNISSETIQVFGSLGSKTCSNNVNAYTITSVSATYYKITITFISNSTASYSQLSLANLNGNPLTGITNWKIDSLVLTDYGNSNTSDIIDNQNKQTETIIQNDKENTQTIIDNNNQSTQDIIDNQNQNNEELKDTINDNFNSCRESNNLLDISKYDSYKNGILLNNLISGKTYTFSSNAQFSWFKISDDINGVSYVQYDGTDIFNYTFVAPENVNNMYLFLGSSIDYSNNTSWFVSNAEMMLNEGSSSQKYEPYGEICSSKLDDLKENQQETNDKLDEQIQQDKDQHEEQMESQQVCEFYDKNKIKTDNKYLNHINQELDGTSYGITDYINIKGANITFTNMSQSWQVYTCFYGLNKNLISCTRNDQLTNNIPETVYYMRMTIYKSENKPTAQICKNGNQVLNDSLNNSDTSGANQDANNFFNNFENNDFGLSDIITLPLTTIQSITSKTCTPLSLTIPFVNKTFNLPCMTTIYSKFEPFYSIYQTITFGVISYWVCVQIYAMVKGFKDPTVDEIEVMDL